MPESKELELQEKTLFPSSIGENVQEFIDVLEGFEPVTAVDAIAALENLPEDAISAEVRLTLEELYYALLFEHDMGTLTVISDESATKLLDVLAVISKDDRSEIARSVYKEVTQILFT